MRTYQTKMTWAEKRQLARAQNDSNNGYGYGFFDQFGYGSNRSFRGGRSNTALVIAVCVFVFLGLFYWYIRSTSKETFQAVAPPDVLIPPNSNYAVSDIIPLAEEAHDALVGSWIADMAARERIFKKLLIIPDGELIGIYNYYKKRWYKTDKKTLTGQINDITWYGGVWAELNNRNLLLAKLRKLKCT